MPHGSGVGGIIGNSYSAGTRTISNSCSFGNIISKSTAYPKVFYNAYGGSTVTLNNCYYFRSIIENNSYTVIDEGAIEITNLESTVESLNSFVIEHKNDYAIPLKEWEIKDGEIVFKN